MYVEVQSTAHYLYDQFLDALRESIVYSYSFFQSRFKVKSHTIVFSVLFLCIYVRFQVPSFILQLHSVYFNRESCLAIYLRYVAHRVAMGLSHSVMRGFFCFYLDLPFMIFISLNITTVFTVFFFMKSFRCSVLIYSSILKEALIEYH